jgi:hypothetical protein
MAKQLDISRDSSGQLIIRKSRTQALVSLVFSIGVLFLWYYILAKSGPPNLDHPFMLLFWAAPLMITPQLYRLIKIVGEGEVFTFDPSAHVVRKDNRDLARYDEIRQVQVRVVQNSGNSHGPSYRLSLIKQDDSRILIDSFGGENAALDTAGTIADHLGLSVVKKT